MESVRKARSRFNQYPTFLSECTTQATVYAACVCRDLNVEKDRCLKEFTELQNCVKTAASKAKVRI